MAGMNERYGKIGRSQLVSTYGVGSIYELRTSFRGTQTLDSVMIAGLDLWDPFVREDKYPYIKEPQLEKALGVSFFIGAPLAEEDSFQGGRSTAGSPYIPCVRFPQWVSCNICQRLGRVPREFDASQGSPKCNKSGCSGKGVPVRLVTSCFTSEETSSTEESFHPGHIDDFPWKWWAHRVHPDIDFKCEKPELYLYSRKGESAGIAGLIVECRSKECQRAAGMSGKNYVGNSLANVFNPENLSKIRCGGKRPWLKDSEECNRPVRALMRGASNVYFPVVASALSIPPYSEALVQQLNRVAGKLIMDNFGSVPIENLVTMVKNSISGARDYPDDAIAQAIEANAGQDQSLTKLSESEQRTLERNAFVGESPVYNPESEFQTEKCLLGSEPLLAGIANHLVKVHKLREVRALRGFHRVQPAPVTDSFTARCASLSKNVNHWLPALEVRGEGVYIELDYSKVEQWSCRTSVGDRYSQFLNNFDKYISLTGHQVEAPSVELLLVHTLSHLLINQLSLDCGYSSASLRERIFVNLDESFCGFLIFTATAGADGTLGGLTRQGNPRIFRQTMQAALRTAEWCASDPLCIDSKGQGSDALNLAACHACCLVSETSCEYRNLFLDRALVIGRPDAPDTGFFNGTDIMNRSL
jgi:hypothetical protein